MWSSKWQPYNISVPLYLKVTNATRLILNIIYVWRLNQTLLELDIRAFKFLFFPRRDLNPHHWYTHYPIQYIKNCWDRLLSNYNIKNICTIYIRLYTCLTSIPRFTLREKVTLGLLKLPVLELDFRAVKFLFFPRRDLNPHHWYTAAPFA
jgi:hypothetical protein